MALINLRNALMAGKRWKNPYITDGLVAMWDGEWNDGGGKHDPNATMWNPVVAPNDITDVTISTGGSFSIGSNYWQINKKYITFKSSTLHDIFATGSAFAIQVVVWHDPDNPSRGFDVITDSHQASGYTTSPTVKVRIDENSTVRVTNFVRGAISASKGGVDTKAHSFSTILSNGSVEVFRDTTKVDTFAVGTTIQSTSYIVIGGIYTDLRIGSIRIYSRALTVDEIARNYAIDKARFRLP